MLLPFFTPQKCGSQENQFLEKDKAYCLKEAGRIGPSTHKMIELVLERDSITHLRKAQAILRLEGKYGSQRLESTCQRALSFDTLNFQSLKRILSKGLDQSQQEDKIHKITNMFLAQGSYLRSLKEFALSSLKEAS